MDEKPRCLQCKHFRNSPQYLESIYKGLTVLSSAYASVRSEDGICVLKDLILAAYQRCDLFEPIGGHSLGLEPDHSR
ncbi:MAG: hypothetical protein P4L43_09410 [Syntrophobacteraceae bacterium]|nr:hypothetical protein [Syntrophobacteraceae bacterium]